MFDADYGPYLGDPRDPRYDDSEELARESWEEDNAITEIIDSCAVNEILWELLHGNQETAFKDLERCMDAAWEQEKKRLEEY